ncbi:MAG: oligosaccharide flippase family protein [Clostridia bacterium]|nr:oligosaccharide flippase family protein [Clostridia bacterium]
MRIKKSLTNIMTGLAGQLFLTITGFVTRTVFISQLGSTYLGVSGLFSNVLTILSFAELGIGQAIVFSLYKPIAENDQEKICTLMDLYAKVYRALFFIVLILGFAILPFLPYIIADIDAVPHIRIIYSMYVANSAFSYLFSYRSTFITATQNNHIINIFNILSSLFLSVSQIATLYLFKNYFVYLSLQIGFGVLTNFVIYIYSNKKFPFLKNKNAKPLPKEEFNSIKKNVGALVIYKIGTIALNSTDNIIISAFIGIKTVGYYSNYHLLEISVRGVLSTIFGNLTASIGNLNASDDDDQKYFMFNVINLATFWFYGVCSICLLICMTPFVKVWIGEEYLLSFPVVAIMCANFYVAGMLFSSFNYRQTMGLFTKGKLRPIISAIINLVVSIVLAQVWGLTGVFVGTIIARLTTNAWYDPYLVFKYGLKKSPAKYFIDYIMKALILIATAILCLFVTSYIPDINIFTVLLKAIVTFIISNGVILVVNFRTKEFKYLLGVVKNFKSIIKH